MRITAFLAISLGALVVACAPPRTTSQQSPLTAPTNSPTSEVSTEPSTTPGGTDSPTSATTPSKAPLLAITSANFHAGEVGIGYAPVSLAATGGVPPYTWSISVGSLPAGLTASTGGTVSGTPAAAGTFAFTVHVQDAVAGSAIVNRSVAVAPYLAVSGLCNNPHCNVEQGCATVCGSFGSQAGGVGPYSYGVTGGALPTGMGLSALSLSGSFPPEPAGAAPQPWRFQVTVTDSFGASATVLAVFHVFPHVAFTVSSDSCTAATAPYTCSSSKLAYTGGTAGADPKVVVSAVNAPNYKNQLPPGFTAVAKGGSVTVTVARPILGTGAER